MYFRGFTALGKGEFNEAHDFFSKAVQLDPTNLVVRLLCRY